MSDVLFRQDDYAGFLVYLNIPFVEQLEKYSYEHQVKGNTEVKKRYFEALELEIVSAAEEMESRSINAIRVGGPSATVVNGELIGAALSKLRKVAKIAPRCEIGIDALPNTVTVPSCYGFSRGKPSFFRINAHSLIHKELEALNCMFTERDIRTAIIVLGRFGIRHIDIRLNWGIPGQTLESWQLSLQQTARDISPSHITLSPLGAEVEGVLGADQQWEMFDYACGYLERMGYEQYAANRFAMNGAFDHYFLYKKTGAEILGFGLDAISTLDGYSTKNTGDFLTYLEHSSEISKRIVEVKEISDQYSHEQRLRGYLHLQQGLDLKLLEVGGNDSEDQDYLSQLDDMVKERLVKKEGSCYQLTRKGMFVLSSQT
jgi:oxygen-independent coproporphyrinogen-3 oxidase